ncbi:hypothetical protein JTB14_015232 [Gonioctena quinquepunctata]|nr:hypothetical protein JTB14_015232 [Gonioctena quinquepunctata]
MFRNYINQNQWILHPVFSSTVDLTLQASPNTSTSRSGGSNSLRVPSKLYRSTSFPNEKESKVSETSLDHEDPYRRVERPEAFTLIEAIQDSDDSIVKSHRRKPKHPQEDKGPHRLAEKQHQHFPDKSNWQMARGPQTREHGEDHNRRRQSGRSESNRR